MLPQIVDSEENDIIFINSAKKFNSEASQCLLGLSFSHGEAKNTFEERAISHNFKLKALEPNDPLLKILL
jgi:hypothetical protein